MQYTPLNKNLGSHLDLTFEDFDGKRIATKDISTPTYLWISGQVGVNLCRKEIPNINSSQI